MVGIYCKSGIGLVRELRSPNTLPPYDENGLRGCMCEINELSDSCIRRVPNKAHEEAILSAEIAAVNHNVRCGITYLKERMSRLEALFWNQGSLTQEQTKCLSEEELSFFQRYSQLIGDYSQTISMRVESIDLDLTKGLAPPTSIFVEVVVNEDIGDVQTANGVLHLHKGSRHLVRFSDVEHLIRQGALDRM
eukprot:Clim_evm35s144 gene=Clim_evmTU35s144